MKHKSDDYKLNAVDYYLTEYKSQEEVCKIFKCSPRSLMRWVNQYNKDGEIKRNNKIYNYGMAYGNSEEEIKFATDTLAEGEFAYKELFKSYEDTVVDFLNDLKIFFKEKSLIQ